MKGLSSMPKSSTADDREMPLPNMMSISTCRNGGATLFLTTFTFTRRPVNSFPSLMFSAGLISRRTLA